MNRSVYIVFLAELAVASTLLAQPVSSDTAPGGTQVPTVSEVSTAPKLPESKLALPPYEERLKAAEDKNDVKASFAVSKEALMRGGEAWIAYALAFDSVQAERAKSNNAKAPDASSGKESDPGGALWAGTMIASNRPPIGSAASMNWTLAAAGLMFLDILGGPSPAEKAMTEARKEALLKPSIHFVKSEPDAFKDDNGYRAIREADSVITAMGLECEPSFLHDPVESSSVRGGSWVKRYGIWSDEKSRVQYSRIYACGFAPNETVSAKALNAEYRLLMVVHSERSDPLTFFKMQNLPTMSNMKRVLGVTDEAGEKAMGRLAYERVRDKIPSDWTVVYTAPNEAGKWTVYVTRNGVVEAFDPPEKL